MTNATTSTYQRWTLARRPTAGYPQAQDFTFEECLMPVPGDDQVLTRTIYLSLDPYQWVRRRSGVEKPGDVCHGRTVSEVIASNMDHYQPGDLLFNTNGWSEYGISGRDVDVFNYMFPRKLDASLAPISTAVGTLGMLGLTAYSGLVVQCQPKQGETLVVSAASGGVGQIVSQIGQIFGMRVVGIAGTPQKCQYLSDELKLDACVSHRDPAFDQALAAACPDGIDVYFENVGGAVFEGVLPLLNQRSRISLCGLISQYGITTGGNAIDNWKATGAKTFARQQVDIQDLFVGNFVADYQDEFLHSMSGWIQQGLVQYKQHIWQGLRQAPEAFTAMLTGENFGKTLVQVGSDPTT